MVAAFVGVVVDFAVTTDFTGTVALVTVGVCFLAVVAGTVFLVGAVAVALAVVDFFPAVEAFTGVVDAGWALLLPPRGGFVLYTLFRLALVF